MMKKRAEHLVGIVLVALGIFGTIPPSGMAEDNTTNLFDGISFTSGGDLTIGHSGTNNLLHILNGGSVTNSFGFIGFQSTGDDNRAIVENAGSIWVNNSDLHVGSSGSDNLLTIQDQGRVENATADIGSAATARRNQVIVQDSGSTWASSGSLRVGVQGPQNVLLITNGASVINTVGTIGLSSSSNRVQVAGTGSVWTNSSSLQVGENGSQNSLELLNGGSVESSLAYIGRNTFSIQNQVTIGASSVWSNTTDLTVGHSGPDNLLVVTNGGTAISSAGYLGRNSSSDSNQVVITGSGSQWIVTDTLLVGDFGSDNQVSLAANGTLVVDQELVISERSDTSGNRLTLDGGTLLVTNATSTAELLVGKSGSGTLQINDGLLQADLLTIDNGASSIFLFNGGTVQPKATVVDNTLRFDVGDGVNAATLQLDGGNHLFMDDLFVSSNSTLSGHGTVEANLTSAGTLSPGDNLGIVVVNGDVTLLSDASFSVELGGATAGSEYDVLQVSSNAVLNGALSIALVNGFATNVLSTDLFTVLSAASLSGTLTNVASGGRLVTVGGEGSFLVDYSGLNIELSGFIASTNNVAPAIVLPGPQNTGEDNLLLITGIEISDWDAAAGTLEAQLSSDHGLLTLSQTNGLSFTTGDGIANSNMVFTGSIQQIHDATTNLTYQNLQDFNGSDTITIVVDDQGFTGTDGAKVTTNTLAITIDPINDPPQVQSSGPQSVDEDDALTFSTLSIDDVDLEGGSMVVGLSVTNGLLTLSETNGLAFSAGDGTIDSNMVFTGTLVSVNNALNGMIYVTATQHFHGVDHLVVDLNDLGQSGSGGAQTHQELITVTIGAVNDPPLISLPGPAASFTEGSAPVLLDNLATVNDVDSTLFNTGVLTVEITANGTTNDLLSIRNQGTGTDEIGFDGTNVTFEGSSIGTFDGVAGTVTLNTNATVEATEQLVRNVTFFNSAEHPSVSSRTVRFLLSDGQGATSAQKTKTVDLVAVNDPPALTLPGPRSLTEQSQISLGPILVADLDAGGEDLQVSLSSSLGTLTLSPTHGLTFDLGSNSSTGLTVSGSAADLNAALQALAYQGLAGSFGTDVVQVTVDDLAHSGTGGALTDAGAITLTILQDEDSDTIPNDWENEHFGGGTNAVAGADNDGDNMTNLEEYIADTNPTNSASVFQVDLTVVNPSQVDLEFNSSSARMYTLQFTTNLLDSNAWSDVAGQTDVMGNGGSQSLPDPASDPDRYYRLEVELP